MAYVACGARTRTGEPCNRPGKLAGGRCSLHGGLSTGPRSSTGKARNGITLRLYARRDLGSIAPKTDKARRRREARARREALQPYRDEIRRKRELRWANRQRAKTGLPLLTEAEMDQFACDPVDPTE